jgi:inorganic pyrophosphatase/exopolyphosphatase
VLEFLKKFKLGDREIAISADNTSTSLGVKKRKGKSNLYDKLQHKSAKNLIGSDCSAHIVHNAFQTASH